MRLILLYIRYFTRRILLLLYLAVFVYLFLMLREPNFDFYFILIPNTTYDFFSQWTTFIYSILIFIIFGLSTTLLEIVLAFANSSIKISREKRKVAIHKYINDTVFEHIVNTKNIEDDKAYIQKIKRKFRTDYPRKIFINRLRRIMVLTTGEAHEHCIQMFHLMKANGLLWTYLHSPFPKHNLFALQVIGEFKVTRFVRSIKRMINKKNPLISSEAMYAYCRLNSETDFNFLIKRKKPISKLDFYNFIQIAAEYRNIDYAGLIASNSPMISALGIRLAGKHGIQDVKKSILKKIEHNDETVCDEAQNSFLLLLESEDVNLIFDKFQIFTQRNKLQILEMLSHYASIPKVVQFYHEIIESYNFELKAAAMNILLSKNTVEVIKYRNHHNEIVANVYKQLIDFNL